MNTKRISIFFYLLLLVAVVASGSTACSLSKIKAQSPNRQSETAAGNNTANSSELSYKPPKRVSRDIIKKDEKLVKKPVKTDK